jgi:hypothetical protein
LSLVSESLKIIGKQARIVDWKFDGTFGIIFNERVQIVNPANSAAFDHHLA